MFRRLSVRSKLLVVLLATALPALLLAGYLGYSTGKASLEQASFNHLTTVRETKASQIEAYFETIRSQVATLSENRGTIEALRELRAGFAAVAPATDRPDPDTSLRAYYAAEFLPRLRKTANDVRPTEAYLPRSEPGRILQERYVSDPTYAVGKKDERTSGTSDDAYDAAHAKHHPLMRSFQRKFGFYDVFLVDAVTARIVYSVFKETDFATDLRDGPYAATNFAAVFRQAVKSDQPDSVHLVDYAPYEPSYGAPAAFIASPVFDGKQRLGVLVFQMPVDEINRVMTGDQGWRDDGLGESGETYLVGRDMLMRSVSRFLIQEPDRYLAQLASLDTTDPETLARIALLKTSILFQQVDTEASRAALGGSAHTGVVNDYRGVAVLSSYRPLAIAGLDWAVLSEMDAVEAFRPVEDLRRDLVLWGLLLLTGIGLLAWVFALFMVRPIHALTEGATRMAGGDLRARVAIQRTDEFGNLGDAFNKMAANIEASQEEIAERGQEIEGLLLNILPGAIATRLRSGEARIADAFPEVSVLFADIVDFTAFSATTPASELVSFLNDLFTAFDELMLLHGVEKIKTIGDCYMAVCGVPQAVEGSAHVIAEVALEIMETLRTYNAERGTSVRVRVGINAGPVVAGVIGSSKYIYDLWGDTVNMASRMESTSEAGTIQVTAEMHELLKDDFNFRYRGEVEVKGKGLMPAYVLEGRRAPSPV